MAVSTFSGDWEWSLNEWRDHLRDIDFWRNGYLNSGAYGDLRQKFDQYTSVHWNVGIGPTACFTRAISSIIRDEKIRLSGPYDHVIEVDMKQEVEGFSVNDRLGIKVAEQLGLLDQEEYSRLMEEDDELRYYTCGEQDARGSLQNLSSSVVPQIIQKLSTKRWMLVVENLSEPIKPIEIDAFTVGICLPPLEWKGSFWLVSTTSQDVYHRSKPPDYFCVIESFSGDDILMLTIYSLHQAAKHIMGVIGHKDQNYWHLVALRCFHYSTMLLIPYCSSLHGDGEQQSSAVPADITSDELIRQWAAQGILPVIKQSVQERMGEVTDSSCHGKYNDDDIYRIGNVILQAFQEYSLLQLPFSPATKAEEVTTTAAHFLAYHGLIAERLTTDQLCDGNHPELERMKWISHVDDEGWHVSREWLSSGASGPTTLIIRHCSRESRLIAKLDQLLAKIPYLRVLDLSYTPLESLPPSICCLQKLQLLSLRGCYNLTSPFSFPDSESALSEKTGNKNTNLLYLDLSYSNIRTFHHDFFHSIPNIQAVMLVKCSNLEKLTPSIVALSRLTTLEVTGTQIKSFHWEIFEEMKKLQSLKLMDNRKLSSPRGLIEITLDGHPTLRSFSLIDAPHIRRLSLCRCTKLDSVDIKQAGDLEELDLSATAIKELSADIPNLPKLKRLLLMGVSSLRRFPWHELQRFPDVFCLDHYCSELNGNQSHPQIAQVCISDSRLFYSFNYGTMDLVRRGQLLKSFYVRVTSSKARTRKMQDEEDMVTTNKLQISASAYADVNCRMLAEGVSMVSMDDVPPFRETERHVAISAVARYPHGLKYLLEVTKSIRMSDDTHVSRLTDLSDLDELEECMLRRCHRMVHVFDDATYLRNSLQNARISNLNSLTHFYGGGLDFSALKHLHLEYCPRLVGVLPRTSAVPSLVTLDILFCYKLKAIFYNEGVYSSRYNLPRLRRIRLQELPQLEHLRCDDAILTAPAWEELYVRGCWSLRRLPRLHQQPDKAVKVSGERAWWAKLRWDNRHAPLHRGSYEHRLPQASASIRERVVIQSYLR